MHGSYNYWIARSVRPAVAPMGLKARLERYGHADRIKDNLHSRSNAELTHKPTLNFYVMQLMKKFNKGWLNDVSEGDLRDVVYLWASEIVERRVELDEELNREILEDLQNEEETQDANR